MIDTPITDALEFQALDFSLGKYVRVVLADAARDIERDLAVAEKRIKKLTQMLDEALVKLAEDR